MSSFPQTDYVYPLFNTCTFALLLEEKAEILCFPTNFFFRPRYGNSTKKLPMYLWGSDVRDKR